jgi:hypothetical protein
MSFTKPHYNSASVLSMSFSSEDDRNRSNRIQMLLEFRCAAAN